MERGRPCVHVHITRSFVRERIPIYYAWTKYNIVSVVRKFLSLLLAAWFVADMVGCFRFCSSHLVDCAAKSRCAVKYNDHASSKPGLMHISLEKDREKMG